MQTPTVRWVVTYPSYSMIPVNVPLSSVDTINPVELRFIELMKDVEN